MSFELSGVESGLTNCLTKGVTQHQYAALSGLQKAATHEQVDVVPPTLMVKTAVFVPEYLKAFMTQEIQSDFCDDL